MQDIGLAAAPAAIQGLPSLTHIPALHACSGIYFLCFGDEVVYIGQAVNVVARASRHARDGHKRFDMSRVYYIPCPEHDLCAAEAYYVALYRPRLNGKLNRNTFAQLEATIDIPAWIARDREAEAASDARVPARIIVRKDFWVGTGMYRARAKWDTERQTYVCRVVRRGVEMVVTGQTRREVERNHDAAVAAHRKKCGPMASAS